jgi:hypothetical protein
MAENQMKSPGATYKVTVDLAGNPFGPPAVKTLQVSAVGQSQVFTFDTTADTPFEWVGLPKRSPLRPIGRLPSFQSLTFRSGTGPALDNVRVTKVAAKAPYLLPLLAKLETSQKSQLVEDIICIKKRVVSP